MPKTIGSFAEFQKCLPPHWAEGYTERAKAVESYLAYGGIVKIGEMKGNWPTLVYPTSDRLERQIESEKNKLISLNRQIKEWKKRHKSLETNKARDIAQRFSDPLYWEHRLKLITDPTYKETYLLVDPPFHLVHKEKWKKRLKLFVKDKEYRIRLHEARTSKIGKKRKGMSKEVEARTQFTKSITELERQKLLEKKQGIERKMDAMHILLAWARESG